MAKKTKIGQVVFDKVDKCITVLVTRLKKHRLYKKQFKLSKKYLAHDQDNQYKVGDNVKIQEIKPISKRKHWEVISKIEDLK